MKKDRLYEITVRLLQDGRTQAAALAEQFGVSTKTIQRDMDALGMAGIPVISVPGSAGGYDISEHFKLDRQFVEENDYAYVRALLKEYRSRKPQPRAAVPDEEIPEAPTAGPAADSDERGAEAPLPGEESETDAAMVTMMFGAREQVLPLLEKAIRNKQVLRFTYIGSDGISQQLLAEPVAVHYREAEWYLFAWLDSKEDYRSYRVARMSEVQVTERHFEREHRAAASLTPPAERRSRRKPLDVLVRCSAAVRARAIEYLQGSIAGAFENGDVLVRVSVTEDDKFWLGAFLFFGDEIEVVSPERVRRRVKEAAEQIAALYGEK